MAEGDRGILAALRGEKVTLKDELVELRALLNLRLQLHCEMFDRRRKDRNVRNTYSLTTQPDSDAITVW